MAFIIPKAGSKPTITQEAIATTQAPTIEPTKQEPIAQAVASNASQSESALAATPTEQAVANPANHLDLAIEQQLTVLISKIESAIPDVRHEMITIHKALAKDPAQVTILTHEQQAAIFAGYSKLSGMELVAKAAAKKGKKEAVSIDMFE